MKVGNLLSFNLADFKEMEEFISNGYFKIQQALTNSQQEIQELLEPITESQNKNNKSGIKENIDAASKNLRNSLLDLQNMHSQQNLILKHFKDITGAFQNYNKKKITSDAC